MSSTIFVGGVHGAGKSSISRELAQALRASHVTAGGLIRENAIAEDRVTVGAKAVPDVGANQMLLLRGLALYRARVSGTMLLDGHFVLLDPAGGIAEIPVAVYEAIAPGRTSPSSWPACSNKVGESCDSGSTTTLATPLALVAEVRRTA